MKQSQREKRKKQNSKFKILEYNSNIIHSLQLMQDIRQYQYCYPQQQLPMVCLQPFYVCYQPIWQPTSYQQSQSPEQNSSSTMSALSNFLEDGAIPQNVQSGEEESKQNSSSLKPFEYQSSLKANLLTESTNINKNYAKAILQYILRQRNQVMRMIGIQRGKELLELLSSIKNKIGNLSHLIRYTSDQEFMRVVRIFGHQFLRQEAVSYIYSSKIQHKTNHIKKMHGIRKKFFKC